MAVAVAVVVVVVVGQGRAASASDTESRVQNPVARPGEHAWGSEPRAIAERVSVAYQLFAEGAKSLFSSSLLCTTALGIGVKF